MPHPTSERLLKWPVGCHELLDRVSPTAVRFIGSQAVFAAGCGATSYSGSVDSG